MNRSLITGIFLGGAAAMGMAAVAGYDAVKHRPTYADVVSVTPSMRTIRTPHRVCWHESVTHRAPTRDPDRVAGTAIGAVVGGVLGNQIGAGSGKAVATVAGAAAGGYAGNQIQQRMQAGNTYQVREPRCTTSYDAIQTPDGYVVHYRVGEQTGTTHMDHDPGPRLLLKDGRPVS